MKKKNLVIAISSVLFAAALFSCGEAKSFEKLPESSPGLTSAEEQQAPPTSLPALVFMFGFGAAGGWLALVNLPVVRQIEMTRLVKRNCLSFLPETEPATSDFVPAQLFLSMVTAVNHDSRKVPGEPRISGTGHGGVRWQVPLVGTPFYWKLFRSVAGIATGSAHNPSDPIEIHNVIFWVGHDAPVFRIMRCLLPWGHMVEHVYARDTQGNWALLFLCPWFGCTRLGTFVPSAGYVIRINRFGLPSLLGLSQAAKLYPETPLVPGGLTSLYGKAYSTWRNGFEGRLLGKGLLAPYPEETPGAKPEIYQLASSDGSDATKSNAAYLLFLEPRGERRGPLQAIIFIDTRTGEPGCCELHLLGLADAFDAGKTKAYRKGHDIFNVRLSVKDQMIEWLMPIVYTAEGRGTNGGVTYLSTFKQPALLNHIETHAHQGGYTPPRQSVMRKLLPLVLRTLALAQSLARLLRRS